MQPNKWSLIREFIESHANCSGDGYANVGGVNTIAITIVIAIAELEYCASAASMLAEEIWQIAEGFVEVPVNLLVQLKKCAKIFQMINNVDNFVEETLIIPQCGKQLGIFSTIR